MLNVGNPASVQSEGERYGGERAMADGAREYLKAKGLDLEKRANLNWNDVASWMGYFAYEQFPQESRPRPAPIKDKDE